MSATKLLDAAAIKQALAQMAHVLAARKEDAPLAIVGIRRGGEPLAQRLVELIANEAGYKPPLGSVDITLYRDDGFGPRDWPAVGASKIPFDIPKHTVVLVDDVLFTGRTVRAGIDAILDYGRPKAIRLAVLVDRGLRELPIKADAVGHMVQTRHQEHVSVHLVETGAQEDAVLLEEKGS